MNGAVAEPDVRVERLPRRRARESDDARLRCSYLTIRNPAHRPTQTFPR